MALIKINGRTTFTSTVTELRKVSPRKYEGVAKGIPFTVEGGRHSGGAAREWFLTWDDLLRNLPVSGPVDAVRQMDRA